MRQRGGKGGRGKRQLQASLKALLAGRALPPDSEEPEPLDAKDPVSLKVARARALAQSGYLSRAAKTLVQEGLAVPSSSVIEKLRALHPKSSGGVPQVPDSPPIVAVDEDLLRKVVSGKLKNGSAGGPSGWTGELLAPLVDDDECFQGISALVRDIGGS